MAAIQKLCRQSWDVFRVAVRDRTVSVAGDSLKGLQEAMTKIQASDLNIDPPKLDRDEGTETGSSTETGPLQAGGDVAMGAPVGYMQIFEDSVLTMGVFIIREGSRIPLHNHPEMHGLLKVLYGNLKVRTFNSITEDWSNFPIPPFEGFPEISPPKSHLLVPTRLGTDQHITNSSDAVLLTPREGNYHSLESVGGPAAFLDILSPPYDPVIGRDCYYFRELLQAKSAPEASLDNDGIVHWLMCISQPHYFWCDEVEYTGPEIDIS